jgi:hypothetical protein
MPNEFIVLREMRISPDGLRPYSWQVRNTHCKRCSYWREDEFFEDLDPLLCFKGDFGENVSFASLDPLLCRECLIAMAEMWRNCAHLTHSAQDEVR